MPIQTTANIWHNGKLIPWEKAQVHVMSHVLHYGSSVFEGLRCYKQPDGAAIFRLCRTTCSACSTRPASTAWTWATRSSSSTRP